MSITMPLQKRIILTVCDIISVLLSLVFAQFILNVNIAPYFYIVLAILLPIVLFALSVYKVKLSRCGIDLVIRLIASIVIYAVLAFLFIFYTLQDIGVTMKIVLLVSLFVFYFISGCRFAIRWFTTHKRVANHEEFPSVLLVGAGEVGQYITKQTALGKYEYNIVGYLDDDQNINNSIIANKKVLGTLNDLKKVAKANHVDKVIITITYLSREKIQDITLQAKDINLEVLIVPPIVSMSEETSQVALPIRSVKYEDFLGRDLINVDKTLIKEMLEGKVVLVTGAGGSIGSEIARQVKDLNPKMLLLADIDESELHDLSLRLHEYKAEFSNFIMPICVDIKDRAKIKDVIEKYKVEIIFHAAAYKHVPMMEYYPEEAMKTNILGTYTLLSEAVNAKVEKVIVISTDKAVNPTNVMGATKRFVELIATHLNNPTTEIVCVRFGNVLGSRGSMLPLFLEQIQAGLPLTVTHKEIVRYFMAIPEATTLVFLAGAMAKGGEVMVLDMGEPVKIYDFAQKMVKAFSDGRSKVIVTGLRPGEKLYEELLVDKEGTIATDNNKVFKSKVNNYLKSEDLESMLEIIKNDDRQKMLEKLVEIIPEFKWQGLPDLYC